MVEVIVLSLVLCGTTTAFLVTLAKLQEEKEKRWDEISMAQTVEKEKDAEIAFLKYSLEGEQRLGAEREEEIFRLSVWHNIMQDRLSALLCPTNNHVWKDGRCVKCGRKQDD